MSQTAKKQTLHSTVRSRQFLRKQRTAVRDLLEDRVHLDQNTVDKILDRFFAGGFLPGVYYYHKTAEEIATHSFVVTQLLNANTEFVKLESSDGKAIVYFVNVGWDFVGKLARIVNECLASDIVRFDSVVTRSGVRIVTVQKAFRQPVAVTADEQREIEQLLSEVTIQGKNKKNAHVELFLQSLPDNYLVEEINTFTRPRRIYRHLALFQEAIDRNGCLVVHVDSVPPDSDEDNLRRVQEKRISVAVSNPGRQFPISVLEIIAKHNISMNRSYFERFECESRKTAVGILSLYVDAKIDLKQVAAELAGICIQHDSDAERETKRLGQRLERIVRCVSNPGAAPDEVGRVLGELRELVAENTDMDSKAESGDFLLNCYSDFFEALKHLDLHERHGICKLLLGFEGLEEFYVLSKHAGEVKNLPGFRTRHSSVRGPGKGGIRLDPIVRFGEVAALSFMMTWKCARTRILFGGGKGGLVINPKRYNKLDLFDTLSNFGRSLFLITGPVHDVPAGDVGCGLPEIGEMFEGFKSALRDLSLMAYGVKKGVALVGNRIVSLDQAREMLEGHFDVDTSDKLVLRELVSSEEYLELVAAAHITGKPQRGIQARAGATGRGLFYALIAAVANLYQDGRWRPATALSVQDRALIKKITSVTEQTIVKRKGRLQIAAADWELIQKRVLPKLLRGKRVVIQGIGKVGRAIAQELAPCGVNVIAVANSSGALIGENLNVPELADHAARHRTLMNVRARNVKRRMQGAAGTKILELDCDILLPCALENAITGAVARRVKAGIVASGGNGTNTSKAENILAQRGVCVVYDFLANGSGVTASYFEWLRNLSERFRYEAQVIRAEGYNPDVMDPYVMPEFRDRIKHILQKPESTAITQKWNLLLRDITLAALNDDYRYARAQQVSMKTAGFVNSICRVLTALLLNSSADRRRRLWEQLSVKAQTELKHYFRHPEAAHYHKDAARILYQLSDS